MNESTIYDVAVIGAGIAGLVTANRAAEQGLRVLVLERGAEEKYLCNSRYTGGFFHVGMQDLNNPPAKLREIVDRITCGHADPALADALSTDIKRGIEWMRANGIKFIRVGPDGYMSTVLAPPGLRQIGLHWEGRGGDVMLRTLGDQLAQRGGVLMRGTNVTGLIVVDGRCKGVEVTASDRAKKITARTVVIADGGFQADADRVRNHISPRPESVVHRGAATGRGDGARMAEKAGAKLVGLECFYGHILHVDALTTSDLWPYPVLDMVAASGIVVDRDARRFCDEGLGGIYITNAIAKLQEPASALVIFDEAIWQGPGKQFLLPANPYLKNAGARMFSAPTIEALAKQCDRPGDALARTISDYNAAVNAGTLGAVNLPRSATTYKPYPIAQPPFYAVPVAAGMTYTLGGILTDADAHVIHQNGRPILGLYAVGATTGGLEGGPQVGYTGGLSKSLVFGLRCAESIARELKAA